ncbi:MAG: succinoglycan biosynthesis protein ExoA [Microbacteriaceae bacterium]|jgi:succinoglycan biosynthesis protein ExoA|nr:glycosyl transferase family 2 [Microbacteriaceae bacterium]MDQ1549564.1 succinoglycan biosynthesis protein ExoA [Microbacteriaceae bacterium]MDQ1554489.1 succinoglycan biosynthesis protein ExoA [Microbacteriaceae bacterium]
MPVLNEVGYVESAVRTILSQDYAGEKELILALGPSTDGTDELIERLAEDDSRIRWVRNPEVDIPVGLNRAIRASTHPIIVRVDAHSELEPGYTMAAVATLERTGAVNVGGVMLARGKTPFQAAVARAYNSKFGLGGARYHGGAIAGPAESAYLGVFRREVLESVGLFDESIRRGEDWELNLRIRAAGHLVWFDPALEVTYWPREQWPKLVRQFFATGVWRGELVRRYGGRNPWRFFVPPMLVLVVALSIVVAVLQSTRLISGWPSAILGLVYLGPIAYLLLVLWVSLTQDHVPRWKDRWLFLVVLPTMHLSWGAGFLFALLRGASTVTDTSRTGI